MNLKSRKLLMTIITVVLLVIKQTIPAMEDLDTTEIMAVIGAYLLSQGVADFGKERAKVERLAD